jgi:hypothetical protein
MLLMLLALLTFALLALLTFALLALLTFALLALQEHVREELVQLPADRAAPRSC